MLYYLVICGATDHTNGHAFSDFMEYCMALRERAVEGDFLSCFPIDEHFMWLHNDHNPPIDVINFGKAGPSGKQAIYTYSRQSYLDGCRLFTQVGAHELLTRVEEWIATIKEQTQEGDVVNIIPEGCRTNVGDYCIGDRQIDPSVFRDLLYGFGTGIQVNAISGTCPGLFDGVIRSSEQRGRYTDGVCPAARSISNRIRSGQYPYPFVQSLAKITLPGVPWGRVSWKICDHEAFMTEQQLMRNLKPSGTDIEPQFYANKPLDGMSAVEEMVFRDKVDVLYDSEVCARCRRIKWPTSDALIRDTICQGSQSVTGFAKAILDSEISRCDPRSSYVTDIAVFN